MLHRAVLLVLTLALLFGCNNSNRGKSFYSQPSFFVGYLRVYIATSFTQSERLLIEDAIRQRQLAFDLSVVSVLQFNYPGLSIPNSVRDVYVYDVPFINSPWALSREGWTDVDPDHTIHVVAGHCHIVPDLVHQLAHSYYFPGDIHHQNAVAGGVSVWTTTAQVESNVTALLKIQRLCTH